MTNFNTVLGCLLGDQTKLISCVDGACTSWNTECSARLIINRHHLEGHVLTTLFFYLFFIINHLLNFSRHHFLFPSLSMASNQNNSLNDTKFSIPVNNIEQQKGLETEETEFNYSKRSQWLRAAVLGANDGLVSTASLMMGVGAVKQDVKAMILTGFAGLVAGACSMAIGEFVSVYSQLDIEVAQMKRDQRRRVGGGDGERKGGEKEDEKEEENLPNPVQAAAASALAFSVGAMVPLLAASFIREYKVRVGVVVAAVSMALLVFGWLGAVLGRSPAARSAVRVLVGGWLAMAITFGLTKLIGSRGL